MVRFYDKAEDQLLKFAVIIAKCADKYVFCKHRNRQTLEIPGGHREPEEPIDIAAERELKEETGAIEFNIKPICIYSVCAEEEPGANETFGKLYFADIKSFDSELHSEIEKIVLIDDISSIEWTYPHIQPRLIEEAQRRGIV